MPEFGLLTLTFSEDQLLKFVAIVLLALAAARLLWPEFSALVRQVWTDVLAAIRALRSLRD